MRFVFRRSGALVGVYIGLVLAYGGLSLSKSVVGIDAIKNILTGVVTASALLHFYYDGFIWKVREKSTRQSLGISGGTADTATNGLLSSRLLHCPKWVGVFVIPLRALWFSEMHAYRPQLNRLAAIVADLPTSARAHINYGSALQEADRFDEAAAEFSPALQLNPHSAKAHVNLAGIVIGKGRLEEAQRHFEAALQVEPSNGEYHSGYAFVLERLGDIEKAGVDCESGGKAHPHAGR